MMVEQTSRNSLGARIDRALTRREDVDLGQNLAKVQSLHKDLNDRIATVSRQALTELESKAIQNPMAEATLAAATHVELAALKCTKCGASLGMPNARFVRCEYCGTVYTLNEYLDRLGDSIRGSEAKA